MNIKDTVFGLDYLLLAAAATLAVFGILFIYSSGVTPEGQLADKDYIRQIIFAGIGLVAAVGLALFNYRRLYNLSLYFYLGMLAVLLYTCVFGQRVNGARSWLGIGGFGIQPSEFAKLSTLLMLSRYLDSSRKNGKALFRFAVACVIVFVPMGVVLLQPDFGTSLVFLPILLVTTFAAGLPVRYVLFVTGCVGVSGFLLVLPLWQSYILKGAIPSLNALNDFRFIVLVLFAALLVFLMALFGFVRYKKRYFYWLAWAVSILFIGVAVSYIGHKVLKDYQIMRLIVFLDPNVDPRGAGWNIIQSVTAIGSGGVFGKGFLHGTQSHYRFLPQQSTDFIFSIFAEEWGLIGGLLLFGIFLFICLRFLRIARLTEDPFGAYLLTGLSGVFIFHFAVNVGMAMGIMPITGIPLLFMSYGGSALTCAMLAIGLAESVYIRRYEH
jgi:rod shape determining protein RodA